LQLESLEGRVLLSAAGAHLAARAHAQLDVRAAVEVRKADPAPISAAASTTGTAVTGGGALTVGPALSNGDTQALEGVASTNNLGMFLTQLAILKDSRSDVQQNARAILNDTRNVDLQLNQFAQSRGALVPSDLMGADESAARQVVATVNRASFDSTYVSALVQAEQRQVGQIQQDAGSVQDSGLKSLLQAIEPTAAADLSAAQTLQSGGGAGALPTPPTSPSSATLSAADLQTLEQSYSGTLNEHFLAQLTDLASQNPNVQTYAEKLISDHEQEDVQLGMYSAATSTYLPASINEASDLQAAQSVLSAVNRQGYNVVYLRQMVKTHTQDIQNNQQTIATTTNAALKQFAQDDIPTDYLHRAGAQFLLLTKR
jgi:predicted outer membrane protein